MADNTTLQELPKHVTFAVLPLWVVVAVCCLFFLGGPAAVVFVVAVVVIHSVYRVPSRWPFSHIGKKVFKFHPSVAYRDSSSDVPVGVLRVRIGASSGNKTERAYK